MHERVLKFLSSQKGLLAGWLLLGVLVGTLAVELGFNEDAAQLRIYGNQVLDYYLSGFNKYPQILSNPKDINEATERFYGTLLELPAAIAERFLFPGADPFVVRHFLNVLFFMVGTLFLLLTATKLGGIWLGWVVLVLVALSPRLLGHAPVNPKDIPFWSAYAFCLWAYLRVWEKLPQASWGRWLVMAVAVGCVIGVRLGGIIWIGYMWLFTIGRAVQDWLKTRKNPLTTKSWQRTLVQLTFTSALGYLFGLVWIPFVLEKPLARTIEGMKMLSDFPVSIAMLFEGVRVPSAMRPWYYPIKWMLITIPLGVIVGWGLGMCAAIMQSVKRPLSNTSAVLWIILFAQLFPIAYVIYKGSNLYSGWRHLLFTYAPCVLVAGWGWFTLLNFIYSRNKKLAMAGLVLFVGLQWHAIKWLITSWPHYIVYFNQIVGGIGGAFGYYDMDYFQTSVKRSALALKKLIASGALHRQYNTDTLIIATNTGSTVSHYLRDMVLSGKVSVRYVRYYQRHQHPWHVAIWYSMYIPPGIIQSGWFPPVKVLHAENADAAVLSVVQARPSLNDYYAFVATQQGHTNQAISLLEEYLKADTCNELAIELLAQLYLENGQAQKAKQLLETANARLQSKYSPVVLLLTRAYVLLGEPTRAIPLLEKAISHEPYTPELYLQLAITLAQTGNLLKAREVLIRAVNKWQTMPTFYLLLAQVHQALGDRQSAQHYMDIFKQLSEGTPK